MTRYIIAVLAVLAVAMYFAAPTQAAHSDHGCHSCHVPHNAGDPDSDDDYGVPLWSNVQLEDADLPVYTLYSSQWLDASLSQPSGPTRLCLGCHDGSYGAWMDSDRVFTAEELANSHPVNFAYDDALATADGALQMPSTALSGLGSTIAQDLLTGGEMHCNGCHDVHVSGIGEALLRYEWDPEADNDQDMCRVCHIK